MKLNNNLIMKEGKLSKEELELYQIFKLTTICNCQNYLRLISDVYFEMIRQTQTLQQELEGIQRDLSLFRAFTKNLYLITASLFRASFGKASSSYKTSTRNFH